MEKKQNIPMAKEQCQQLTDAELLKMVQKAEGHTKDFSQYMLCDFSYSFLTNVLRSRGYEHGWYKTSETQTASVKPNIVLIKRPVNTTIRQSFIIDAQVAEDWKEFNNRFPYGSVTTSLALRFFMANVKAGRIKFELDLGFDTSDKGK